VRTQSEKNIILMKARNMPASVTDGRTTDSIYWQRHPAAPSCEHVSSSAEQSAQPKELPVDQQVRFGDWQPVLDDEDALHATLPDR
jgi:hypothetical protein